MLINFVVCAIVVQQGTKSDIWKTHSIMITTVAVGTGEDAQGSYILTSYVYNYIYLA